MAGAARYHSFFDSAENSRTKSLIPWICWISSESALNKELLIKESFDYGLIGLCSSSSYSLFNLGVRSGTTVSLAIQLAIIGRGRSYYLTYIFGARSGTSFFRGGGGLNEMR